VGGGRRPRPALAPDPRPVGRARLRADAAADAGGARRPALWGVPGALPDGRGVRRRAGRGGDPPVGGSRLQPPRTAPARRGRGGAGAPRRPAPRHARRAAAASWRRPVHRPGGPGVRVRARRRGSGRECRARPLAGAGPARRPAAGRRAGARRPRLGVEPGGAGPRGHGLPGTAGLRSVPAGGGRRLRVDPRRAARPRPVAAWTRAVAVRGFGAAGPRPTGVRAAGRSPGATRDPRRRGLAGRTRSRTADGWDAGRRRPRGGRGRLAAATRRAGCPGWRTRAAAR
jgi:hypothetical protein